MLVAVVPSPSTMTLGLGVWLRILSSRSLDGAEPLLDAAGSNCNARFHHSLCLFAVLGFAGMLSFSVVLVIGILIVLSRLAVLRFSHR